MSMIGKFLQWLRGLFGGGTGNVPNESTVRLLAEEERQELFAQVDGLFNNWQKSVNALENANKTGQAKHQLEELQHETQRLEKKFKYAQVELRDSRDVRDMQERSAALESRVRRLQGGVGDGPVTAKDEFIARKRLEKERENAAQEEELLAEQLRDQEERYRVPALGDTVRDDDDFGLDRAEYDVKAGKVQEG